MTRQRFAKTEDRKAAWSMHHQEVTEAKVEERQERAEVTEAALQLVAKIDRDIADLNQRMARIEGSVIKDAGENDA